MLPRLDIPRIQCGEWIEFQLAFRGASHERLGGYPGKFDMEFPSICLMSSTHEPLLRKVAASLATTREIWLLFSQMIEKPGLGTRTNIGIITTNGSPYVCTSSVKSLRENLSKNSMLFELACRTCTNLIHPHKALHSATPAIERVIAAALTSCSFHGQPVQFQHASVIKLAEMTS
jgi:hypothetical protein